MATIATHSRNFVAMDHNYDKAFRDKEEHVDPDRSIIILEHQSLEEFYAGTFSDSIEEFNSRQKRKDRRMDPDYLGSLTKAYRDDQDAVKQGKKKQATKQPPVREMIVGVYHSDLTDDQKVQLLTEYYEGFKRRNPNMGIVGAVIHMDEAEIHMHLDYVPVSHGNNRGMSVQNSMSGALREQGFSDITPSGKQQRGYGLNQWVKGENDALESLCVGYGLTVEHPDQGTGRKHKNTPEYKAGQEALKALNKQIEKQEAKSGRLDRKIERQRKTVSSQRDEKRQLNAEILQKKAAVQAKQAELDTLDQGIAEAKRKAGTEAEKIKQDAKQEADQIIARAKQEALTFQADIAGVLQRSMYNGKSAKQQIADLEQVRKTRIYGDRKTPQERARTPQETQTRIKGESIQERRQKSTQAAADPFPWEHMQDDDPQYSS